MPTSPKPKYIGYYVRDTKEMQDIYEALNVIAKAQKRPLTHLMEDILREAVKEHQSLIRALQEVHARYSSSESGSQEKPAGP